MTDFDVSGVDDDRVSAWEVGLPNVDNFTPLSYPLILPELTYAFSITLEPYQNRAENGPKYGDYICN